MSELKTQANDASVTEFLNSVDDATKKQDSYTLLELFSKVTGENPKMWGSSIIGFGTYHYKSERSAQEGDWLMTGFSPRKQALTLYILMGFDDRTGLLEKLGKYKTGKGCLYIKRLSEVDMEVLERMIAQSHGYMKAKYGS